MFGVLEFVVESGGDVGRCRAPRWRLDEFTGTSLRYTVGLGERYEELDGCEPMKRQRARRVEARDASTQSPRRGNPLSRTIHHFC